MRETLFEQLNTDGITRLIRRSESSLFYAAPSIHSGPAEAIVSLAAERGPELIQVFIDLDESVLRMGFGDIEAIALLEQAGIDLQHVPGLRCGLIVSDELGFSFSPTALFLEKERPESEGLNAMRLMPSQAREAMSRLASVSKPIALCLAKTPGEIEKIEHASADVIPTPVTHAMLHEVDHKIQNTPPIQFDVARQVRVFQPHFQYVELSLKGAAIQRQKLNIPQSIQRVEGGQELEGRLKTTFDLLGKDATVTSKALDNELRNIRDTLTKSLGKKHGRIVLKTALPALELRLLDLRNKIEDYQASIKIDLEKSLSQSKQLVMDHYLPSFMQDPPDVLLGIFGQPSRQDIANWLYKEISQSFPSADELVKKIQLDVSYKDVSLETILQDDFLDNIKDAYPEVDWDAVYAEFKSAGEYA